MSAIAPPSRPAGVGPAQGLLFDDDLPELREDEGYRGPTACRAAGITYRQLDYWARTGLVEPSVRSATGSGTQRLYGFRDILVLKVVKRLLDAGISLQQIRTAIGHLLERGVQDLSQVTLMSDGISVYECTTDSEVIDLLRGGQGMFAIALGGVWRDIEGTLLALPGVITQSELEEKSIYRHQQVAALSAVVMIQCVGSRNTEAPYCSRVCCSKAVKNAIEIKKKDPKAQVYILHKDIRTYGFRETMYKAVSYTHLRAHETPEHTVCRLLLEKQNDTQ